MPVLIEHHFAPFDDPAKVIASFFDAAAHDVERSGFKDACPIATVALEVASTNERLRIAMAEVFASCVRDPSSGGGDDRWRNARLCRAVFLSPLRFVRFRTHGRRNRNEPGIPGCSRPTDADLRKLDRPSRVLVAAVSAHRRYERDDDATDPLRSRLHERRVLSQGRAHTIAVSVCVLVMRMQNSLSKQGN